MSPYDILTLFGGLAMFLYGMRLMGDGLKQSASGTLKHVMEKVTNNPLKAFILGLVVTALIQSSTATIVITSGLVAAGVLTLHQSLGIIIGANVGTTVTGQIIRLMDIDASSAAWLQIFSPSTLAPVALIIGIILIMGVNFRNAKTYGNIAVGFGILFSGLLNMTGAVSVLTESGAFESLLRGLSGNPLVGYLTGAAVAFVLQSSSATIGILQAFSASGLLTFRAVYPVIVGVYLGDCVTTAIVCSIGQKQDARRVGVVNILFNVCKSLAALAGVSIVFRLSLINGLMDKTVNSGIIADTNTIFNLGSAILLFPLINSYERLSRKIVKDEKVPENPYKDKFDALNPAFFRSPALALNSCYDILLTMLMAARQNVDRALGMLGNFNAKQKDVIYEEEHNIDMMTDAASKYMVQLLPSLHEEYQIQIIDEYYRNVTDFERLGDHAVNICDNAEWMDQENVIFSKAAFRELDVYRQLLSEMFDEAERSFRFRDVEAAFRIEPLADVADELLGQLKMNHLQRMVSGQCNPYADASFMNLLGDLKRMSDLCTNVGEATLIRVHPSIAEKEHSYFAELRSGNNEDFNLGYQKAHEHYGKLMEIAKKADNEENAQKEAALPVGKAAAEKE